MPRTEIETTNGPVAHDAVGRTAAHEHALSGNDLLRVGLRHLVQPAPVRAVTPKPSETAQAELATRARELDDLRSEVLGRSLKAQARSASGAPGNPPPSKLGATGTRRASPCVAARRHR